MNHNFIRAWLLTALAGALLLTCSRALALDRTNHIFKVFQFPADQIPRIDGNTNDWNMVPQSYVIGSDQLVDDNGKHKWTDACAPKVAIRVGWVNGLNRLYFLYEANDNYWDFLQPGLHNDTFELVVDGDLSGGPLIARFSPVERLLGRWNTYFSLQGTQAQNYHIFTPAKDKSWCMVWGPEQWVKRLPYANAAYRYHFKPGQPGHLVLEFYITPFDYAGGEGPQRAVESILKPNKLIGMSFALIDYDNANSGTTNNGFWNLSRHHTMYGHASDLCLFKLMPLEARFHKPIEAHWTFKVVDMSRRLVVFKDQSIGKITSWHWNFGDGETSTKQNPIHAYKKPGHYVVVLDVSGPAGKSRFSRVWDVTMK